MKIGLILKKKILNGWLIAVNLTQRMDKKIESKPKVGLVNGLAVYGPNSGAC